MVYVRNINVLRNAIEIPPLNIGYSKYRPYGFIEALRKAFNWGTIPVRPSHLFRGHCRLYSGFRHSSLGPRHLFWGPCRLSSWDSRHLFWGPCRLSSSDSRHLFWGPCRLFFRAPRHLFSGSYRYLLLVSNVA